MTLEEYHKMIDSIISKHLEESKKLGKTIGLEIRKELLKHYTEEELNKTTFSNSAVLSVTNALNFEVDIQGMFSVLLGK